ncbi:MAG: Zn-ribbon domain-containing OB-fold protein [Alphaproteobacteria bacterium]|nr:Zn-ribbon domain-containing OB-fold protein [Alphaproteobacteria bacterium]
MTEAPYAKPLPRVTPDNKPFFDGLRAGALRLPRCAACDRFYFPPGPVCPFCFSEMLEWSATSGRGTVSSWVVVHKAWFPAFQDDVPYNVVQVELEEGPRLTSNIVDIDPDVLRIGLAVEAVYDAVTPDMTLLRFRRTG